MTTPAWFPVVDWTTGDVPTAAQFDGLLRDNLDHLGSPCSCQAVRTTNLSVPDATFTDVTLPAENWDTDALHSTSSNTARFTVPTGLGGRYHVEASVSFAAGAGEARAIQLAKNGTAVAPQMAAVRPAASPVQTVVYGAVEVALSAGDYVTVQAYQDTGGALNVVAAKVSFRKVSN